MPTPSKFNAKHKEPILEAVGFGSSLRTAAAYAGLDHKTLLRWLKRGEDAPEGSSYREFYEAVHKAKAEASLKALRVVQGGMLDDPKLAFKFLERREPGFAPPMPNASPKPSGPVVINLTLDSGAPVIEGEVVEDEQDSLPDTATPA